MILELVVAVAITGCPQVPGESDWIPPPQEGVSIAVTEAHTLSLDEWWAVRGLPDEYWLARTGWCESRLDPTAVNGPHRGAWQVREDYHGSVPADLRGQAEQASRIHQEQGNSPWAATEHGCDGWR